MSLDPVGTFMLGIIVGQWLGVLLVLKVVRSVLNRPNGTAADELDASEQPSLVSVLVNRYLGQQARRARSTAKPNATRAGKSGRRARK